MRMDIRNGRYQVRHAVGAGDVLACQRLRHRCFHGADGIDHDVYDGASEHLMVVDRANDVLVGTLRYRVAEKEAIRHGYTAQFYDVAGFASFDRPTLEIGRFCTDPARHDPHVVRATWGAVTQIVDQKAVCLIFGCTSFAGIAPAAHARTFQRLAKDHIAPDRFGTFHKSTQTVALTDVVPGDAAQTPMPPLLRTYLAMGGWVSGHAVIDQQMQTMHVLTGLEIAQVPPARAKALRALV